MSPRERARDPLGVALHEARVHVSQRAVQLDHHEKLDTDALDTGLHVENRLERLLRDPVQPIAGDENVLPRAASARDTGQAYLDAQSTALHQLGRHLHVVLRGPTLDVLDAEHALEYFPRDLGPEPGMPDRTENLHRCRSRDHGLKIHGFLLSPV